MTGETDEARVGKTQEDDVNVKSMVAGGVALGAYALVKLDALSKQQESLSPYSPDSWQPPPDDPWLNALNDMNEKFAPPITGPAISQSEAAAFLAEKERRERMGLNPHDVMQIQEAKKRDAAFLTDMANTRHRTAMQVIGNIRH